MGRGLDHGQCNQIPKITASTHTHRILVEPSLPVRSPSTSVLPILLESLALGWRKSLCSEGPVGVGRKV